jgi:asparagine synthase (glutamine-hydrolysing)
MAGGTDLKYSRQAADYIKSQHTEVIFTADEALSLLKEVIYATETWDTTTIRASTG